ncbi:hypothetical protein Tdes44962_MAKER07942 [Teratosphaeria destructans]|uniref:Uncharacterized protein n=1 Tax=Teratosphaeria destructans TaxID=418781 RepID=A0A9W7W5K6_9PEZI|nr:hypothetical protein Tdes44962_MAKER07942 [Teratosphaeria destructans]
MGEGIIAIRIEVEGLRKNDGRSGKGEERLGEVGSVTQIGVLQGGSRGYLSAKLRRKKADLALCSSQVGFAHGWRQSIHGVHRRNGKCTVASANVA